MKHVTAWLALGGVTEGRLFRSLRKDGAVQDMIAAGIELPAILQAGRWKNTVMVQPYGERLLAKRGAATRRSRPHERDPGVRFTPKRVGKA